MGEAPAREIRAYWPGRQDWALRTTIGAGAALTVDESNCRFAKRKPRPRIEGAAKAGGAA
jgi:hypothetical protein